MLPTRSIRILMLSVIGRIDKASFHLLELKDIDIKIDTGAYTSSIHCRDVRPVDADGRKAIRCNFLDPEHASYHGKEFTFFEFTTKKVKSSNGQIEVRYKIRTEIEIFHHTFPIDLTLSERGSMRFPVLIGRKFLKNRFVVDASRKYLSAAEPNVIKGGSADPIQ